MLFDLFPEALFRELEKLDMLKIQEIRLRLNKPIVVNFGGKNIFLETSLTKEKIVATKQTIEHVLCRATENSVYAYNSQIKQGFITAKGGIRLGIAGESVVSDSYLPKTLKDICSINVRVPHEVKGCSAVAFRFMFCENCLKSTLIISPPGAGKTTFLRDIACQISKVCQQNCSVLIVDERFEIASVVDGLPMLDVGDFSDIVSGATKKFAFENGIRALRPNVIITDELACKEDADACKNAIMSGVKVVASIHGSSLVDISSKSDFKEMVGSRCFERYVVLSGRNGAGTIESIFDENGTCIYF